MADRGAGEAKGADDVELSVHSSDESEDEDLSTTSEDEIETGLTENQGRLLYMIGLYTQPARTADEKEEWIRKNALLVLIYEAIVTQVIDYDYAPMSEMVENRRIFVNISQEGRSDLDFLREEELVNGMRLASKHYNPVTTYQVSEKGLEVSKKLPRMDKEAVHELCFTPGTRELLQVEWTGSEFFLVGAGGFKRISTITDCEDVSYVSSAYLPQCLRFGGRPTLSNAHRAHECGVSADNIRDDLDEVITLNSVSIVVAEYIPFGANQIVNMNNNLGSTERVQGGFFTALMDTDAAGTKLEVDAGLTSINILDYTLTKHVNFEADIHIPEDEGVVQVETFGVSMNADGTTFYGMQVEAVMDRIKDHISLDHLSRLLVDVHTDSSTIVDSVLSAYQRQLLHLIFQGDTQNRDKVNLLVCNEITPHLTAEEYMDKGEYENELKQVLGDTRAAFDISEHDTLVFGEHGLLIAGPNSRHHEPLLCSYLQFNAMDIFVRNFFTRLFLVLDHMKDTRRRINKGDSDPRSLEKVRSEMQIVSADVIHMGEVLGYLTESLESCEIPPEPADQAGRALYERLQIPDMASQLSRRVLDLRKNMEGTRHELDILREMSNNLAERHLLMTNGAIKLNTENLVSLTSINERAADSLEILQVILSGVLAFDVLDRITGTWSVVDQSWMQSFTDPMMTNTPMAWFLFSLFTWLVVGFAVIKFTQHLMHKNRGKLTVRIEVRAKVKMPLLNRYLGTKNLATEHREWSSVNQKVTMSWMEANRQEWGGYAPTFTITYDENTQHLLFVNIHYNKREAKKAVALTALELKEKIATEFDETGMFEKNYSMLKEAKIVAAKDR